MPSTSSSPNVAKSKIDEIPQLWNVLTGDMSLVGPRPERPPFVQQFKERIPQYMLRHKVKSGLTGWAQVNGRTELPWDERIELDDPAVLGVLEKMVKQRRDSVSQYDAAGREDLSLIERDEMAIIEHYLPAKMGEAEVIDAIDAAVLETGATGLADIGKLMAVLKPQLAGKADMGDVSKLVKQRLSGG